MSDNMVTRADIAEEVRRQVGLSRSDSDKLVKQVIDSIVRGLITQGLVKISLFGSFIVHSKKARMGRNPKTGVAAEISPRRVLTFRAGDFLKDKVLKG